MPTDFVLALVFFLLGVLGGSVLTYLAAKDYLERKADQYFQEVSANRKRTQLERNGRSLPKRDDAAPGASRVHKITTRRNR